MQFCKHASLLVGLAAFSMLMFLTKGVQAQAPSFVTNTVTSKVHDPSQLGRDLWFTMCQNYDAGGGNGKYYMLYVTSMKSTTVHIQVAGSSVKSYAIQPNQVVPFNIPLSWELTTSGEVENKAIHVWSTDADLSAYLLSRNPATSDGMYIIPSKGWGTSYVVASYTSLFELSWDYPSEFAVVANQNNTVAQITPSWDIRVSGQPTVISHVRHKLFTETLQRGQCAQYMLTQASNPDDWDATGTLVNSNNQVGLVGASQCANIPTDFPWCDHICEMIPPIRTWGSTYYSAPFARRKGGDSFLVIASEDGQTIFRADSNTGSHVFAILNKYQYLRDAGIDQASKWFSDKPFLLVQYINSTSWPGYPQTITNDGIGDPAMVVLNSVEQFSPSFSFQTPTILGGQNPFSNYITVIVPSASAATTKLDAVALNNSIGQRIKVDGIYDLWSFPFVAQGTHTLVSDAPVGSYVYGYGAYDSYAWPAMLGTTTVATSDTFPPTASSSGGCFCSTISLSDTGALSLGTPASGLASIVMDSASNFTFTVDPKFVPGSAVDSASYNVCVVDPTKPATLITSVYDLAGNHTTISSRYIPQPTSISPAFTNFGRVTQGVKTVLTDTISNPSAFTIPISGLHLSNGKIGFSIDSADQTPLKSGEKRLIKIGFTPISPNSSIDTLIFGTTCQGLITGILLGNASQHNFAVSDQDFGCIYAGDSVTQASVTISNFSSTTVTIDSIWSEDPTHFSYVGTLPIRVAAAAQSIVPIPWKFRPDSVKPHYATAAHYRDTTGLIRTDSLFGCALSKLGVDDYSITSSATNSALTDWLDHKDNASILLLPARPNPVGSGGVVTFTIGLRTRTDITLKLFDLLGKERMIIFRDLYHPGGTFDVHLDTKQLDPGVYFYRLEANDEVRSGRLVVQR